MNGLLSRYTSQTFAGVSPITATECLYASHSLLGLGTATQALVNIRRFAAQAVGETDWIDRVDALAQIPFDDLIQEIDRPDVGWQSLRLSSQNPFSVGYWQKIEVVFESAVERTKEKIKRPDARLPLVVCYSGRDGFRSTQFSLTAPLEIVAGCNAYGWTPMTLTHEICHVWINGILGALFQDMDDPAVSASLDTLLSGHKKPRTVLEDLQFGIYICFQAIHRESLGVRPREAKSSPANVGTGAVIGQNKVA